MNNVVVIQDPIVDSHIIVDTLIHHFINIKVSTLTIQEYEEIKMNDREILMDVLILDIDSNEEYVRLINTYRYSSTKTIVMTSNPRHSHLLELFHYNLAGVFYSKMSVTDVIYGVSEILDGRKYIHPVFSTLILEDYLSSDIHSKVKPTSLLTDREWSVLQLLSVGKENREVADSLLISEKTVKQFVSSILRKLEVKNRTEAVIYAYRHGWIELKWDKGTGASPQF